MRAAGLKAIGTVVSSTAVLVKAKKSTNDMIPLLLARIRGLITAQRYVICSYNIHKDQLEAATKITPGNRAPTITPLHEQTWFAVSSMVESSRIATVMDELPNVGAKDILVFNIANSRV